MDYSEGFLSAVANETRFWSNKISADPYGSLVYSVEPFLSSAFSQGTEDSSSYPPTRTLLFPTNIYWAWSLNTSDHEIFESIKQSTQQLTNLAEAEWELRDFRYPLGEDLWRESREVEECISTIQRMWWASLVAGSFSCVSQALCLLLDKESWEVPIKQMNGWISAGLHRVFELALLSVRLLNPPSFSLHAPWSSSFGACHGKARDIVSKWSRQYKTTTTFRTENHATK